MFSFMIVLSLIASTVMAVLQASQPASAAPSPAEAFAAAIEVMKTSFSFQSYGPNQDGLVWTKGCDAGWDAQYKLSCEKDGVSYASSWMPTVVTYINYQGPKIRMGPNGPNACAQAGGMTRVYRWRYGLMEDVTDKLLNFDGNANYDGKDAIFWDQYGVAC